MQDRPHNERVPDLDHEPFYRHFTDWLVLGFGLLCAVFVVISPEDRHLIPYRIVMCLVPAAAMQLAALLLRRFPGSRLLWVLRYAAPFLFLAFFFRLTGQIAPFFPLGHFDPWIVTLDGFFFGDPHVSIHFQETWPFSHPVFGEVMCLSYLAYFFFIPVFGGILAVRAVRRSPGPSALLAWYAGCVVLTYYLHYLVFFLFPVKGPVFHLASGIAQDPGYVVNRLHHLLVSNGDVPGGCFPSSHVAIAFLHAFIAARLGWRWLCAVSWVIALSICLSIVYTMAHYATDAPAGLLSAWLCWVAFGRVSRLARKKNSVNSRG